MVLRDWLADLRFYLSLGRHFKKPAPVPRRQRQPLLTTVTVLEDRVLLSGTAAPDLQPDTWHGSPVAIIAPLQQQSPASTVEFFITPLTNTVTEDPTDADHNKVSYTIGYTGDLAVGKSASVDVNHLLADTSVSDYVTDPLAAITAAAKCDTSVDFDGTTLTFFNHGTVRKSASGFAGKADTSGYGDRLWQNAADAVGDTSGTYASVDLSSRRDSNLLKLTDFDLNIPHDAVIQGIKVRLVTTGSGNPDNVVISLASDGVTTTATGSDADSDWSSGIVVVGGANDRWGRSWTAGQLNSDQFGVLIKVEDDDARVHSAEITVAYSVPADAKSLDFTVEVAEDTEVETAEDFRIDLSNPATTGTGLASVATSSASVTIVDDDTEPEVPIEFSIAAAGSSVMEEAVDGETSRAAFTISYTGTLAAGEVASVEVAHRLGSTDMVDYTTTLAAALAAAAESASGVTVRGTSVEFTGGTGHDTQLSFILGIRDDDQREQPESFSIALSDVTTTTTGTSAIAVSVATTAIRDNDNLVRFSLNGDSSAVITEDSADGDQNRVTYTIRLDGDLVDGEFASVNVAQVAGSAESSDFSGLLQNALQDAAAAEPGVDCDGTRVIFHGGAGNATSLTFSLSVADDTVIEPSESFSLQLDSPETDTSGTAEIVRSAAVVTRTIMDNDNWIDFSVTGSSSVTEDPADGDHNKATYTISYTGDLFAGESASVDVVHLLNDTESADYVTDLVAAISAAAAEDPTVEFNGTTLTFHQPEESDDTESGSVTASHSLEFSMEISDDRLIESSESFSVTLQNAQTTTGGSATIGTSSATTSIASHHPVVSFDNISVETLAEDSTIRTPLKVADIVVDNVLGTFSLALSGADEDLFEVTGSSLFLKADSVLDYETNPVLDVGVGIDDPALAETAGQVATLSIAVTDVTLSAVDDEFEVSNTSRREAVELDVLANDFSDLAGPLRGLNR